MIRTGAALCLLLASSRRAVAQLPTVPAFEPSECQAGCANTWKVCHKYTGNDPRAIRKECCKDGDVCVRQGDGVQYGQCRPMNRGAPAHWKDPVIAPCGVLNGMSHFMRFSCLRSIHAASFPMACCEFASS